MAPSNKCVYYKDLVGDWTKAHRELLRLLFTDEGGRESPSKHVDIDARLAELEAAHGQAGGGGSDID